MVKILSLVVALSIFSSANLYAHDSCNVELNAGLLLNENTLEFFNVVQGFEDNKQNLYKIENDHSLIIQGHDIDLNNQQQILVTQYAISIRAIISQVKSVATEGIDLALDGVSLVFNELLGEGNSIGTELTQELLMLRDEVATYFTKENSITIGENSEEVLGKKIEQRIESIIEKAIINSMGSLLIAMSQEILLSGEDGNTLDTRMNAFGKNIANEMELRADKIEGKADALCLAITNIDILEEQLKLSIPALKNINVISATFNE
jgi:hypothetical protein